MPRPPKRGKYTPCSVAQSAKVQVLASAHSNGNWREVAKQNNVPQATAYRWVAIGHQSSPRGGFRKAKLAQVHLDYLEREVKKIRDQP